MISTKGRYALRVMIDISVYSNGEYISLKDISAREDISLKYLEQVIQLLVRNGLVQSLRGNNGGYRLAKDARDITAKDVLQAAEGSLAPVACLQSCSNECERKSICSTVDFWKDYYEVINKYLGSKTIADFRDEYNAKISNEYSI